jgi:hypothetical protein
VKDQDKPKTLRQKFKVVNEYNGGYLDYSNKAYAEYNSPADFALMTREEYINQFYDAIIARSGADHLKFLTGFRTLSEAKGEIRSGAQCDIDDAKACLKKVSAFRSGAI